MPLLFPAHGEVELISKALAATFIFYRAGLDLDAKKPTSMVSDDIQSLEIGDLTRDARFKHTQSADIFADLACV
jgi:hypothetical protein